MPSLPKDNNGHSVLAIAVDCFSKWVEVETFEGKHANKIAEWFERDIIARFGVPRIVRSDNGKEFDGEFA